MSARRASGGIRLRRAAASGGVLALAAMLASCSVDTLIWGPEGAGVIRTAEELVAAVADGGAEDLVCSGRELDLGEPQQWDGLSAEEPERFVEGYWEEQAELDPAWSINLSLPADRAVSGETFPGDVFFREIDGELCLVDIAWSTVVG